MTIKKVLVAGSEGSLMQKTIPYLLEEGYEVVGVDNFQKYGKKDVRRDYKFVEADLTDKNKVDKLCSGSDSIIQAAAQLYGIVGFHKRPADILSKDTLLHQNLLYSAVKNSIERVTYISSSMVYEKAKKFPLREEDTTEMKAPSTHYGLSKFVGEKLCEAFKIQYGLDYTIWRVFNVFNPEEEGGDEQGVSHVFADFNRKIIYEKQNPLEILGDGNQIRCFTWIEDTSSAIAKYSFDEKTKNQIFNLGGSEPIKIKDLALKIFKRARKKGLVKGELKFNYIPIYDDDVKIRIPDIEKTKKVLGWEPTLKLDEMLDKYFEKTLKN
jgi:UDP-glucose 4-epimerase